MNMTMVWRINLTTADLENLEVMTFEHLNDDLTQSMLELVYKPGVTQNL